MNSKSLSKLGREGNLFKEYIKNLHKHCSKRKILEVSHLIRNKIFMHYASTMEVIPFTRQEK